MPNAAEVATLAQWQNLACDDAEGAAREVLSRIASRLSPAQQKAVFAGIGDLAQLTGAFRAGTSVSSAIAGVPFALKDLFFAQSFRLRAGSGFPDGIIPQSQHDGVLPARLRSLGAVLLGTTHLHEFAYGLTGQNVFFGDCEHPRDAARTSGGSSSGSAVAVAKGIVPFAIGTDTGGSIRVPAAFCGLHGVRLHPMDPFIADAFPLSHRFDSAGWFASTSSDLAAVTQALLGSPAPLAREPRGVYLPYATAGLTVDAEVEKAVNNAASALAPSAHVTLAEEARRVFAGCVEAYAILQSTDAYGVHREWLDLHRAHYSEEVWQRIDRGRRWTPSERERAQAKLVQVRTFWHDVYQEFDYVVLPATPFAALRHSECSLENRNRLLALTTPASMGGLPVRTVPVPLPSGLTAGLQIVLSDYTHPLLQGPLN